MPSPTPPHQKGNWKKKVLKRPNYKPFINHINLEVFYKISQTVFLQRQGYYLLTSLKDCYFSGNEGSLTQNCLVMNSHLQRVQTKARDSSNICQGTGTFNAYSFCSLSCQICSSSNVNSVVSLYFSPNVLVFHRYSLLLLKAWHSSPCNINLQFTFW